MSTKPWVETIRRASGLIEHIDDKGVGHPAYGSVHWMKINGIDDMGVHGCNGSCSDKDWQIESLKDSVEYANHLIKDMIEGRKKYIAAAETLYLIDSMFEAGEDIEDIKKAVKVYTKHQLGPGGRCPDCKKLVCIGTWHHDHIEDCPKCGREREM